MGRGDKRSRKGKIFKGSFGNSRPQKAKKTTGTAEVTTTATKVAKPKKATAETTEKKATKKAPAKKAAAPKKKANTEE